MSKTILVVEDNPIDRDILIAVVEKLGYRAETCEHGQEALQLIPTLAHLPDVILLDIHMPEVDGISLLGHLRSRYKHLPIIIVSGSDDPDDVKVTEKLGAVAYLHKPVSLDMIKTAIEDALRGSHSNIDPKTASSL